MDKRVFESIVTVAKELGPYVISDEVYADYSFNGHVSILEQSDVKYVLVSSFSKGWGMTGYRMGYAVSDTAWSPRWPPYNPWTSLAPPSLSSWPPLRHLS